MSKKNPSPTHGKHLTLEDRICIYAGLQKGTSFKVIAAEIGKHPTTISYEVKARRHEHTNSYVKTEVMCPNLLRPPYVCNACPKRRSSSCRHIRWLYEPSPAHKAYLALLHDAREGIPLTKHAFYEQDRIISSGIKAGQHLYHVLTANPQLHLSISTAYRHFKKGYYSASVLDLPRAVKFKPRKPKRVDTIPTKLKVGRTHEDFLSFLEQEGLLHYVEIDTVIGEIGGKVILTIHFTAFNFMAGLLLNSKTAAEVGKRIRELKLRLREEGFSFAALMPVILTDNGGEFADVFSFEEDENGKKEGSIFFCDPMRSSQKARIEKNHTLFRDIVPKGSSFNAFTQETVNRIFSHVNSVKRKMYQGKSAYEMFTYVHSRELAAVFGITEIAPEDVIQSPLLLE